MVEVDDVDGNELGSELIEVEPSEALLVRIPVGTARAFAKRTLRGGRRGPAQLPVVATP